MRHGMNSRIQKLILLAICTMVVFSCNEDFISQYGYTEKIQWSTSTLGVDENDETLKTLRVQLVGAQRAAPINVSFSVTDENVAEGVDYEFPNGKTLTIPANSSVGELSFKVIDNEEFSALPRSLTLMLEASEGLGAGSADAGKNSIKISILEDDCPIPSLAGTYLVTNRDASPGACGNPANDPVLTYEATITLVSEDGEGQFTYNISDVTGGLYALCYGDGENPGDIQTMDFAIVLDSQPDVVYGGDEFNGTGVMDCDGNFTLTWSNGFGDKATSTYVRQ